MSTQLSFRISTHLKDVIGRDLVTNEFVAIFELVKNAFDAGAAHVQIEFDPKNDRLIIVDDGKGMSEADIREKWLFVAYSAKADGTEDSSASGDYRDRIKLGSYAGSKGIGRFSCDTLGRSLKLYTGTLGSTVTELDVIWERFEKDSSQEFDTVQVSVRDVGAFPNPDIAFVPNSSGTMIWIEGLRHFWNEDRVTKLRSYLAKLIDPFGTTDDVAVSTFFSGSDLSNLEVNGEIGNNISDLLREKTSRIQVVIDGGHIVSTLVDRGRLIYQVREPNPFSELANAAVNGEIFFLNRSAKQTFSARMKVRPVEFGSVFLFLNGFRIFPIGEEFDDTFGLNRRKQQGSSRYLGTRDILGRVDVQAPPKMFREASSRDAGLIDDANRRALYDAILRHMVFRLERYVVGVNWKDKFDQNRETSEGLEQDPAKRRILEIVGGFARSKNVEILKFDQNIVELADAREEASQKALNDLSAIAEREGDEGLLKRIEATRARIVELEESERESRNEAKRLFEERARSDVRIGQLERQARFLSESQDLDAERIQLLLHQVNIYSGHIHSGTSRALATTHETLKLLDDIDNVDPEDMWEVAGTFRHNVRQLMDDLSYIRLENDRLQSVSRFAPNIRVDLDTSNIEGDLVEFLGEYFSVMLGDIARKPMPEFDGGGINFVCIFSPFDMAVVIDNLIDNARKATADKIRFVARRSKGKKALEIVVTDDGTGLDRTRIDVSRIFEKHYTATVSGTGLGLYHVSQVLKGIDATIELDPDGGEGRADFVITIPEKPE